MDITERKKSEDKLKTSEEKFKSLVKNAPNIIIITDQDGTIQFINHTVSGLSIEKTIGTKLYDYIDPEYHKLVKEKTEAVFKTGKPQRYEISGAGPNNSKAWYYTKLGPIKQGDKITAVTLIVADITEQKNTEAELKKAYDAIETSPNATFTADLNGKVTYANAAAAKMWGFKNPADMLDTNVLDYWAKDDHEKAKEIINILIRDGFYYRYGLIGKRKDGTEFLVEANSTIMLDDSGKQIGMTGSFSDITEQKETEDELKQKIKELEELKGKKKKGFLGF